MSKKKRNDICVLKAWHTVCESKNRFFQDADVAENVIQSSKIPTPPRKAVFVRQINPFAVVRLSVLVLCSILMESSCFKFSPSLQITHL